MERIFSQISFTIWYSNERKVFVFLSLDRENLYQVDHDIFYERFVVCACVPLWPRE